MDFRIREANIEDITVIFNFICKLAEYEKLRDDVTATAEILKESLFVKRSAEVLIAEEGDQPVGFALFFHNFSTFKGRACLYLEDIFVLPEHRGKGYGKALFGELASIAIKRECDRFDWAVLNWNEPSIKFYESMGATPMSDWTVYRLTGEALRRVAKK